MQRDDFTETLLREDFEEAVTVTREAHGFLDTHVHPFEAKALILSGELHLRIGGVEQAYRPGQVFHLMAGEAHCERYGSEGVHYLVGRKWKKEGSEPQPLPGAIGVI
ncbi:MAG: hypothetical protein JWR74_1147 [Polaromonas sp.]|jgi:quercetin dioxygenase-like cupin family protein|nr:hypothetical protein [Polaromonas sp.]